MSEREDVPAEASARERLARSIHASKSRHYASLVAQHGLPARPGVQQLIDQRADAGIALAVATTTSRGNVEALFPHPFGEHWRERFQVLVCAEGAPSKEPDTLVYRLALAPPSLCVIGGACRRGLSRLTGRSAVCRSGMPDHPTATISQTPISLAPRGYAVTWMLRSVLLILRRHASICLLYAPCLRCKPPASPMRQHASHHEQQHAGAGMNY